MRIDRLNIAVALLLTVAGFSACSADDADVQPCADKGNVVSLTSTLADTRAASDPQTTQLNTAVEVGVFGISGGTAVSNGSNARYGVKADGGLTAKSGTMEWPSAGSISLYAYAPFQSGWTWSGTNSFSVAADQTTADGYLKSDLLYGTPASNPVSQTETAVPLTFRHLMAKMTIKVVKSDDDDTDLTKASLTVSGTKTATTLTPQTGTLGEATGDAADIKVAATLGTEAKACAVLVPQQIAAGTELVKMVVGDRLLTARIATAVTLESGKAYTFSFNIVKSELLLGQVTIADWATGDDLGMSNAIDETANVESSLDGEATEPAHARGH